MNQQRDVCRPGLGTLKRGDVVLTFEGTPGRNDKTAAVERVVAKVGRAWVTVVAHGDLGNEGRELNGKRFRLDTQDDASRYGYPERFVTVEQYEYDERVRVADRYLDEQGVDVRHRGAWSTPERRMLLAKIMLTATPTGQDGA